jgi:coatomer protein complex subunit gamma
MTQYHALALLYAIKKHDRLAVSKLVAANVKAAQTSPLAMCLLVRAVAQLIRENPASRSDSVLNDFLDNALRFHNDMVVFEAASCIVSLPDASTRDFNAVVGACQSFLTSQKPTRRYGALRLLSRIASVNASAVSTCNLDLESLLTDSNRAIATLAITTLLKTGAENSVERLMKQMQSFLSDISDDHKIVVVEAIRSLCFKYPSKHRVLISHLQSTFRPLCRLFLALLKRRCVARYSPG